MKPGSSTLILPVETQVRELDAKILLSCVAADRGFPVILGSRAFLHYRVGAIPRGVYLAKSMRSLSDRMFGLLRSLGHEIVAWDEEALVRYADDHYLGRRLSEKAVRNVSHLFSWGDDDAEVFRSFPAADGIPIHTTGNPRIDLMRPEIRRIFADEVSAIRAKYGDFVLVNTNFGFVNSFVSGMNLVQPGLRPGDEPRPGPNARGMTPEFARGVSAHKRALFDHFQKMLPALAQTLSDHAIVVRPHPSESHEVWHRAAANLPNVHVVNEGTVIPWLMAARVLVHNGCTTAVEAAVLDTPAVAYQPVEDECFDLHLPNELSARARDEEQLRHTVRRIADGGEVPGAAERRAVLERHVASVEGPLAADRIIDVLVEAGYLDATPTDPGAVRRAVARVLLARRTMQKRINMRRPGHRNHAKFHAHRFPGVTLDQIRERIERLQSQLDRFHDLRVAQLSEHIFRVAK